MSATSSSPVRSGFIATTAAATGAAGMILLAALSYAQSVTAAEAIAIDPFCTSAGDPGDYPSRPAYLTAHDARHPGLTAYYAVSLRWAQPHECRGLILHSIVQRKIFHSRTHAT
jgi:hypothetical protein